MKKSSQNVIAFLPYAYRRPILARYSGRERIRSHLDAAHGRC